MFEMIPRDRINSVQEAIKTSFGPVVVQQTARLTAGSLSIIVKITIHDKPYILRVMDLEDNLSNRQNQIQCLKRAEELGLGPSCLYANAHEGILITEYISPNKIIVNRPWLKEIAALLQMLHADDTFPVTHQPLFEYMDMLITSLRSRELSPLINNFLYDMDQLKVRLGSHLEYTSCHNDLNFTNLLYDGKKTYFIDWEAAGQEDPFFDIATLCNEFITNDTDMTYFLEQYFNSQPTSYQQAKVLLMRQISYCYLAIHFLDHAANAGLALNHDARLGDIPTISKWKEGYDTGQYNLKSADDFILYAMTKIKASIEQMQSNEFALALNQFEIEQFSPKNI